MESIHRCISESEDTKEEWESNLKTSWQTKPTFCVGPSTASTIHKLYGLETQDALSSTNVFVSHVGNSEDLAKLILKGMCICNV